MDSPNLPEHRAFSEIVKLIYDTAADSDCWPTALQSIRRALNAHHVIAILAPRSENDDGVTLFIDEDECRSLNDLEDSLSVDCPFASIAPLEVATLSDLMGEADWFSSPFYLEAGKRSRIRDILSIEIRAEDQSIYRLRFTRTLDAICFSSSDREFAKLLVPHLHNSLRLAREATRQQLIHRSYAAAFDRLGIASFVLDRHGCIFEQNGAADKLIEHGDGLTLRNRKLIATFPGEDRALRRLLYSLLHHGSKADVSTHVMGITRERGGSLGLVAQRISWPDLKKAGAGGPVAVMFVRDPELMLESRTRAAQILFHLTPAEAVLLMYLANGRSLPEAAADLSIRHSTARAHLRSIFAKTGTTRQSSLVRQVLNSVAMLADDTSASFSV